MLFSFFSFSVFFLCFHLFTAGGARWRSLCVVLIHRAALFLSSTLYLGDRLPFAHSLLTSLLTSLLARLVPSFLGCGASLLSTRYERALPFGFWRADEHHMHHAFVKCNYGPYTTFWDRVYGTFRPFALRPQRLATPRSPQQQAQ